MGFIYYIMENWKEVTGYEGMYEVSDLGNVRSVDRFVVHTKSTGFRIQKGAIKKQGKNSDGYSTVVLFLKNKNKSYLVHRLIGIAFIPNPENKDTINHKDGNKSNNNLNNLEWNSHSENTKHAWRNGLISKKTGDTCNNRKLTSIQVSEIRKLLPNNTHKKISEIYGVSRSAISAISIGQNWK